MANGCSTPRCACHVTAAARRRTAGRPNIISDHGSGSTAVDVADTQPSISRSPARLPTRLALASWRLGDENPASAVLRTSLWVNPADNHELSELLPPVEARSRYQESAA
ncbi:hypothetical protein OIE66_08380 [Nonomuraea sp. NBC_01738]|uniref:hypothetical protein n=1 Tax=Nonomuraea sp. NBC_01738 TaxID=2976003 RepID=UPI002E0F7B56|nr:hypothetical protein OIE66_08380 [Nonomuraea sp. NBC_01738]